ncbi:MAG TPA: RNA 2',3'-cyclic phosphodiesterase [Silvibacterium sp.]|nr:RNA 2',3'-cyclic phosphodiesterase [Silvibacterium sp.]
MRLFIGIPLAATVTNELSSVSLRLRSTENGLRWSAPETWHITLQFLGNTTADQHACIVDHLRELRFRPLSIQFDSVGFFDRAGVFFAAVALTPELLSLQQRVVTASSLCGFSPETRPYHPHITLARTKGKGGKQSLVKLKNSIRTQPHFTSFSAEEFVLYESFLKPSGSQYIIRDRFPARH